MKLLRSPAFASIVTFALALAVACGEVPIDTTPEGKGLVPGRGVVRGAATYVGPAPCSRDGELAGTLVIAVYQRENPPPPLGTASAPVVFTALGARELFGNRVAATGSGLVCPPDGESTTASVPFTIAPLVAGEYVVSAFFDRRGAFLPTLATRNGPAAGDVVGGAVDIGDGGAVTFRTVFVGDTQAGYVTDNVTVVVQQVLRTTRPHFYVDGITASIDKTPTPANPSGDEGYVPLITMTQDHAALAPPANAAPANLTTYQNSFVSARLSWGVTPEELEAAVSPAGPFYLQVAPPTQGGGLFVFQSGQTVPESANVAAVWPTLTATRLIDDPTHTLDPQSITVSPDRPLVTLSGLVLRRDLIGETTVTAVPTAPGPEALTDHLTVLLRPVVLCSDPRKPEAGGVLVTPHLSGQSADPTETAPKALFDAQKLGARVREVREACLPTGKFALRLSYPTGQSWTVPNEAGSCSVLEGRVSGGACAKKPRPVLASQGPRGVLEILPAANAAFCEEHPVPTECIALE